MLTDRTPLACLFIPMGMPGDLLLPNTVVAEIIDYRAPEAIPGTPSWFLGHLRWRGGRVPLLHYAAAVTGDEVAAESTFRCILITHVLSEHARVTPFMALASPENPRLIRIREGELRTLEEAPVAALETLRVHLSGEDMIIPDLEALEALAAQASQQF